MNAEENGSSNVLGILVGCGVAATVALAVAVTLIRHVEAPAAHVGDIVAFNRPGGTIPFSDIVATRSNLVRGVQTTCVLDPQVLASGGGSLVVEHQDEQHGEMYQIHWAGPKTASDATDCGLQADLLLTENDLTNLAIVAGGFGIESKTLALGFPAAGMRYAYN